MVGYTPGPWFTVPSSTGEIIETRARDRDGGPYLIECPGNHCMSYSQTICRMHWRGTNEWAANAHLVAHAPKLFEILDELVAEIEGPDADIVGSSYTVKQASQLLRKIRGES